MRIIYVEENKRWCWKLCEEDGEVIDEGLEEEAGIAFNSAFFVYQNIEHQGKSIYAC